jgi:hypothetical protein
MPSSEFILANLAEIAHRFRPFAVGFHVLVSMGMLAWLTGWRPSREGVATLLGVLLLSPALFAVMGGVPFNGAVLLLVAALSWSIGRRLGGEPAEAGSAWQMAAGVTMMVFGLSYPHFVDAASPWTYLYAAPTGLLPCPTLSLIVGIGLFFHGLESRAWSAVMASAGLFYGLVGAFRLGVTIDLALCVGALALLGLAFAKHPRPSPVNA